MRIAIIAASLAISACAAHTQASSGLDSTLDALIGQPVDVAFARLGQPIGSATVGTDRVYGWGRTYASTEFSNAVAGPVMPADYRGGVFPQPRRTVQKTCVIRMVVGADGLIRDWDYQGADRDCRSYSARVASRAVAPTG
jgi:hypothetical protein